MFNFSEISIIYIMKCLKYKYNAENTIWNIIAGWDTGELSTANISLSNDCNTKNVGRLIFNTTVWTVEDKKLFQVQETVEIILNDGHKVQGFAYFPYLYDSGKTFCAEYVVTGGVGDFKNAKTIKIVYYSDQTIRQVCVY